MPKKPTEQELLDKYATLPPRPKAYKIVMSRGDDLKIDADEIETALHAIEAGQPAKIRSGIFNPSFYISIIEDKERITLAREMQIRIKEHNEHEIKYSDHPEIKKFVDMRKLDDIFKDIKLLN